MAAVSAAAGYYGEIPQAELHDLLAEVNNRSWRQVVYDRFAHLRPELYRLISDESRADFRVLLPLPPGRKILVVGADWGTIALALAREGSMRLHISNIEERLRQIEGKLPIRAYRFVKRALYALLPAIRIRQR